MRSNVDVEDMVGWSEGPGLVYDYSQTRLTSEIYIRIISNSPSPRSRGPQYARWSRARPVSVRARPVVTLQITH